MHIQRVCLWSSPRNLSTALMYSFAQRPDTTIVDEPLYAHYLRETSADHPGRDEILESQVNDGNKVINNTIFQDYLKPVVFFKQMTHHLVNLPWNFLLQTTNIIYIRDPKQIITSYAAVRDEVNMKDIGMEMQWQLFSYLKEKNHLPIVLDSGELLKAPEKVLKQLCSGLNIEFNPVMLSWTAGARTEDGVWAKYWYGNVHQSTGFLQQETSSRALPSYLEPLYEQSKTYYDKLVPYSIKA